MRRLRKSLTAAAAALALGATALGSGANVATAAAPAAQDNSVLQWNATILDAVRTGTIGPPMVARALAIFSTCMYDAWSAYTASAVGTQLGGSLRRPAGERTLANKNEAISYGAYMAAKDLYPGSTQLFRDFMTSHGYDPDDTSTDTTTPVGIGNVSCQAVLDFRHEDGSNQLGDEPGGTTGVAYSDYTGYAPVNDPMDLTQPYTPTTIHDPSRWQPLKFIDGTGTLVTQKFMVPQWQNVNPFALVSMNQFRGPAPALYGSTKYQQEWQDLVDVSANLTDEEKSTSEYWADGPHSETPPGHWNLLAQFVSRRDGYGANTSRNVDHDVRMFFALNNGALDASIVAWDNKRQFDSIRPISAIRYLFNGQTIKAWGGPYQGTVEMDGSEWFPYQSTTFPTPPFASYSSGHSTFSATSAEILKLVTGSDYFGFSTTIPAGSSKIEPGLTPRFPVTFYWSTFLDAAHDAGISRRYGGIHPWQDDFDAQADGISIGSQVWAKALACFTGNEVTCKDS